MFLQGSSAGELAELVEQAGGTVTHHLHIIDAVGAKVTGAQLAQVVDSPAVTRFMDDLADSEVPGEPEEEEKPPCRVRGSIELDFQPDGFSWRLYNKHDETAVMKSITLDWPDQLGAITSITVGETALDSELHSGLDDTAIELTFSEENGPRIDGMKRLAVSFESPPGKGDPGPRQRDFDLEATFHGPCETDLVPGYENNHEDYYYNTAGGVDELHKQGLTGKGVTVAVVDSGLWEHELLVNDTQGKNRLVATYDAITDTEGGEVVDESGHGSHMTSIIANSGKTLKNGEWTGTYKGVAPDARLVAVKVLDRQGLAHMLDIVRGVQWVVDHRAEFGIDVVNLSFSQELLWPHLIDPVNEAVREAWQSGLLVVVAAGNSGPEVSSIGSPGNITEVVTVGLVTDSWTPMNRLDDYVPEFSARGPTTTGHIKPDLVAFGAHMSGIIPTGSALSKNQPEDLLKSGEFVSTGTSQAAAFASGAASLYISTQEKLPPMGVKCVLQSSAEPAIDKSGRLAYSPFEQGAGQLMISRAFLFGTPDCGQAPWQLPISDDSLGPAIRAEDDSPVLVELKPLWPLSPQGEKSTIFWGAKAWVETIGVGSTPASIEAVPASSLWFEVYEYEAARIEKLSETFP